MVAEGRCKGRGGHERGQCRSAERGGFIPLVCCLPLLAPQPAETQFLVSETENFDTRRPRRIKQAALPESVSGIGSHVRVLNGDALRQCTRIILSHTASQSRLAQHEYRPSDSEGALFVILSQGQVVQDYRFGIGHEFSDGSICSGWPSVLNTH